MADCWSTSLDDVAPRAGAWIETFATSERWPQTVAPRAGAWIETVTAIQLQQSPPARGRGLKPWLSTRTPSRVRASPPARGRGSKRSHAGERSTCRAVAPRAGAWIETQQAGALDADAVAPRAGAWIETCDARIAALERVVAPRAGAWIETLRSALGSRARPRRPPRGGVD